MLAMRSGADDVQMMCGWCVHVQTTCRWHTHLRTMCGWCPDDICHPPAQISNEVSLSCHPHVVCMSSAHRMHETSVPRLFQVKQQRTALLKTQTYERQTLWCSLMILLAKICVDVFSVDWSWFSIDVYSPVINLAWSQSRVVRDCQLEGNFSVCLDSVHVRISVVTKKSILSWQIIYR